MQSQSPVLDLKNIYHGLQFRAYIVKREQPNKDFNYPAMCPRALTQPNSNNLPKQTGDP